MKPVNYLVPKHNKNVDVAAKVSLLTLLAIEDN